MKVYILTYPTDRDREIHGMFRSFEGAVKHLASDVIRQLDDDLEEHEEAWEHLIDDGNELQMQIAVVNDWGKALSIAQSLYIRQWGLHDKMPEISTREVAHTRLHNVFLQTRRNRL